MISLGTIIGVYRWLASPLGRYYLRNKRAEGLSEQLEAPLLFLLSGRLTQDDHLVIEKIESIRAETASRSDLFVCDHISSEQGFIRLVNSVSASGSPPGNSQIVSSSWVANVASVSPEWGAFLYLCAKASRAEVILEMGSCAGISGCYMASTRDCKRLITIEGSAALAALAETNISRVSANGRVINALFHDGLSRILPTLDSGLDLVYIDGHHEKEATLSYFERVLPFLNHNAIVIFDDIRLYCGMWEAWQALSQWEGVGCALNVGRFGLCVWEGASEQPRVFDFSPFTGLWRVGGFRTEDGV